MSLRRPRPAAPTCVPMKSRFWALLCLASLVCLNAAVAMAQTTNATVNGQVTDPQGNVVPDTEVDAVNIGTNVAYSTKTNRVGIYSIPALPPGPYRIHVRRDGFKEINMTGLILHTQDTLEQNFSLEVGSVSESVTIDGSGLNINTTNASVSTVVDRQFVDTMPLNGRSFQSLILVAPGTVTGTPQTTASQSYSGEFSVNGQRADANYFTVDGVSANNSPDPQGYGDAGSAGGLQATTALGTTQALVSVDALQEFKIQTSTYSAEYGRQPGAQIAFETRSGTTDWHGSAFDYLRNDVFDANNWFNDDTTPPTAKPAERQNDFGGTIGGPLTIPKLNSGSTHTFFFLSYEGLRLTQPQPAKISYVPSTQLRTQAPAALQPVLNAFPLPNCTTAISAGCVDPGNGLSPYLLSTSLPSSLDAISARFDEQITSWLHLFFRFGSTDSSAEGGASTDTYFTTTNTKTFTLGADGIAGPNITNQFRINYSPAIASSPNTLATYGGATPVNLLALNSIQSSAGEVIAGLSFPGYSSTINMGTPSGKQHQWNLIDTLTRKQNGHFLHLGIDYRRTAVTTGDASPELDYVYSSQSSVVANSPEAIVVVAAQQQPQYTNFSAFIQDDWRVKPSVSLSLGLRWELNPPPSVTAGIPSLTVNGTFGDPSSLSLAPAGTPLYHTTYYNFAPRMGIAVVLHNSPGRELVFRSGGGVFFDTGQQESTLFGAGDSPGTGFEKVYPASTANAFPFTSPLSLSLASTLTPPYSTITTTSQHLQLPYTFQWNATLEQALGTSQSISIGYVGANGRRLLEQATASPNNNVFTSIRVYQNGLSSSYNALQAQYRRTLSRGLQVLGSYTWSHAFDFESQDTGLFPYQRGNSAFDIRNNVTAALSYDLPKMMGSRTVSTVLGGWGSDLRATARGGFPVTLNGNQFVDPTTGNSVYSGVNLVPAVPIYLYSPSYPGGRRINPAAFALPAAGQVGNAPRNVVRGFGENEINIALRREFPIRERLGLQLHAESFNVLNHPNFGFINATYGNALFGEATKTLANSLGGLTSLYQQGGPRSLQFSLRLHF